MLNERKKKKRKKKQQGWPIGGPHSAHPGLDFAGAMSEYHDTIRGGLADEKSPADFDQDQLARGIRIEIEHTDDLNLAREIAMDHLTEDPDYYKKLSKMEKHESVIRAYVRLVLEGEKR